MSLIARRVGAGVGIFLIALGLMLPSLQGVISDFTNYFTATQQQESVIDTQLVPVENIGLDTLPQNQERK